MQPGQGVSAGVRPAPGPRPPAPGPRDFRGPSRTRSTGRAIGILEQQGSGNNPHGGKEVGCRPEKKKQRNGLIIVLSLSKCFGEEEEGEQLFSFLREEQETSGLILESVTFRLKACL